MKRLPVSDILVAIVLVMLFAWLFAPVVESALEHLKQGTAVQQEKSGF